ncbi:ATP-binding cassette domain-containing protein [Nocardia sp. R7R-8]|uniref:ATP-binding cassette domain-containing protein n=1 Tax=Nocardia sp. R7R-8 TaxID=3459304 RepID=UPI00403DDFBA
MSGTLLVANLRAWYGKVEVLHGVDLAAAAGEIVALVGPNGAGKTTLLRSISRTVRTTGGIAVNGTDVGRLNAPAVARLGVGHVPQGRGTFPELSVGENLRLGSLARGRRFRSERTADLDRLLATFPILREFLDRPAGALSGGQQQMLALARALLGRPMLLLVDEPSIGLAPSTTLDLFRMFDDLRADWGLTILLAEQNARLSLQVADQAVVLSTGQVMFQGTAAEVAASPHLRAAYLGKEALT